jgi:hypothetical protein
MFFHGFSYVSYGFPVVFLWFSTRFTPGPTATVATVATATVARRRMLRRRLAGTAQRGRVVQLQKAAHRVAVACHKMVDDDIDGYYYYIYIYLLLLIYYNIILSPCFDSVYRYIIMVIILYDRRYGVPSEMVYCHLWCKLMWCTVIYIIIDTIS